MKLLKVFVCMLITLGILCFSLEAQAASIGLSVNKTTVTEGDTFTITISGINGRINISCSSNITLSTSGSQWVEGTMTITGTAKSSGTGKVTVEPVNASTTGAEPEKVTVTSSKNITIKAKETPKTDTNKSNKQETTPVKKEETQKQDEEPKSNNSFLSKLEVEGLNITPEFNKDVTKYFLSINQDVKKLNIIAEAEDSKSKVEINNPADIKFGKTDLIVKVIAEDESTKEYIIEVNKEDTSLSLSSLSISSNYQNLSLSPKFDKNTTSYTLNTENASNLDIEALANYEDANIEITGNSDLIEGENTITITVKKDKETKVYTIKVNNTIVKKGFMEIVSYAWNKLWIVFVITVCSLVQTGIAIYYVINYYKDTRKYNIKKFKESKH